MPSEAWTPEPTRELTMPDRRTVTYCCYGAPDGVPVVSLGGAPSIRWERPDVVAAFEACGLRVLVPDRPGYGGSTRRPGRLVADVVDDVRALAEAQGWRSLAVTGHSCGGPHALACAALLPERVARCAVVAGIAPADAPGIDFFGRDKPGSGPGFLLARQGEQYLRPRLIERGREVIAALEAADEAANEAVDEGTDEGGSPGRLARLRASLLGGLDGWVDDDLAVVRPWGFDVRAVTVPVTIWYGSADYRSPRTHADWLMANVPGAQGREYDGGHDPGDKDLRRILAWLRGV
jgi:pimeloyl-ACP methyl ester carboxylesterase